MAEADVPTTSVDGWAPEVRSALDGVTSIVVPVDDGDDDALARARSAAIALAAASGARLVLLDRSDTTYADTPRIHELGRESADELDRPYLVAGIDEAEAAGVEAIGFQHSLPGDEALSDTVAQVGAEALVVPASLSSPGLFGRLKGDVVARAEAATSSATTVFVVADGGSVTLADPA